MKHAITHDAAWLSRSQPPNIPSRLRDTIETQIHWARLLPVEERLVSHCAPELRTKFGASSYESPTARVDQKSWGQKSAFLSLCDCRSTSF